MGTTSRVEGPHPSVARTMTRLLATYCPARDAVASRGEGLHSS